METVMEMKEIHISDDSLRRYDLGMITDDVEVAELEKHLLSCPMCMDRAN